MAAAGESIVAMPPPPRAGGYPVTNIRNTSSPHWRAWLKPENRCLVPFNSFAEYAPEPDPEPKKKDVVWFALNDCAGKGDLSDPVDPIFSVTLCNRSIEGGLTQRILLTQSDPTAWCR